MTSRALRVSSFDTTTPYYYNTVLCNTHASTCLHHITTATHIQATKGTRSSSLVEPYYYSALLQHIATTHDCNMRLIIIRHTTLPHYITAKHYYTICLLQHVPRQQRDQALHHITTTHYSCNTPASAYQHYYTTFLLQDIPKQQRDHAHHCLPTDTFAQSLHPSIVTPNISLYNSTTVPLVMSNGTVVELMRHE